MKRFLKILSNILLILNPISGFFIVAFIFSGHWYLTPISIIVICLTLKFHFYAYREECLAFDKWYEEMKKTHTYLGLGGSYHDLEQVWENNETKERIYL